MATSVPKKADRFPLFKHSRGYWAKTVLGRHRYFGRISEDPDGKNALKRWLFEKDYLLAGLEPPSGDEEAITILYLCNKYIASKESELNAGEIGKPTFEGWKRLCQMVMATIPKSLPLDKVIPDHFEKLLHAIKTRYRSPNSRGQHLMGVRSLFNYAFDMGFISRPPTYCPGFNKPSAKVYRKHRAEAGDRSLTRVQVWKLLDAADVNMRVAILLGLQAGFSNIECALLPRSAIQDGWLVWPRAKTGIERKIPLWKETQAAIKKAIAAGPVDGERVIYRKNGKPFRTCQNIMYAFEVVAAKAGVECKFYDLRRTLQTVAENHIDNFDLPAIQAIMGHCIRRDDMSSNYRQNMKDERLIAVTDAVRKWLGTKPKGGAK